MEECNVRDHVWDDYDSFDEDIRFGQNDDGSYTASYEQLCNKCNSLLHINFDKINYIKEGCSHRRKPKVENITTQLVSYTLDKPTIGFNCSECGKESEVELLSPECVISDWEGSKEKTVSVSELRY